MGIVRTPKPVKLIAALMSSDKNLLVKAKDELIELYGDADLESDVFAFDHSDYYKKEMGDGLLKQFVSFENLIHIESLPQAKLTTNHLEISLSDSCDLDQKICRQVNIDPGYISPAKLVLATTKNYDHRVYVGQGIYAEVTLHYTRGKFQSWEWTYSDYRKPLAIDFFTHVRNKYFQQLDSMGIKKIENI